MCHQAQGGKGREEVSMWWERTSIGPEIDYSSFVETRQSEKSSKCRWLAEKMLACPGIHWLVVLLGSNITNPSFALCNGDFCL